MNAYCLMDGAMAVGVLRPSKIFNDETLPWLTPLIATKEFRLVKPFLVDFRALPKHSPEWHELLRALDAFPHRLHAAQIDTELSAQALAEHLYRFAAFRDSCGDTYSLRIADARVMAYLPRVLTNRQWREMTAPIARWEIRNRQGAETTIHESNSLHDLVRDEPEIFTLSDDQIEQLMHASEPDALLATIQKQPTLQEARSVQLHYDAACACVGFWKSIGNPSRGVLHQFATLVFEREPGRFKDEAWLQEKYRQALKTAV